MSIATMARPRPAAPTMLRNTPRRAGQPATVPGPHLPRLAFPAAAATRLTAAEEADLARRRADGEAAARDELVGRNLPLALHVARKHMARLPEDADDIISCAAIGLIYAVDRFDPGRGVRFSTYAVPWIQQGIARFLREDRGLIHVPSYIQDRAARAANPPFAADADRALALRPFGFAGRRLGPGVDYDFEVADGAAPPPSLATLPELAAALGDLDDRHRDVLERRFGLGDRPRGLLREIAADLGLTRERIRQIEVEALNLLRASLAARGITSVGDLA